MKCTIVKSGAEFDRSGQSSTGNHLLQRLYGASLVVLDCVDSELPARTNDVSESLAAKGEFPFVVRDAGSIPVGCFGYALAVQEIISQLGDLGVRPTHIVHTSGSGGTQAGLILGTLMFAPSVEVIGVATGSRPADDQHQRVATLLQEACALVGQSVLNSDRRVIIEDGYSGGGYGYISGDKSEVLVDVARTEGLLLDPVYTVTSMVCLRDLVQRGRFRTDDVVVYVHTGGVGGLFPYSDPLGSWLESGEVVWQRPPWSGK